MEQNLSSQVGIRRMQFFQGNRGKTKKQLNWNNKNI